MGIHDFFKIVSPSGKTIKEMGVLLSPDDLKSLKGMKIVIDAPALLHAAFRGMPSLQTMTYKDKTTAYLNVIFFNAMQFVRMGVDQLWVFDGKPPSIKSGELDKRQKNREKAVAKASVEKDSKKANKLEIMGQKLFDYVYVDTKRLLSRMGISWAVAPEEGEGYCSYLNKKGIYDYVWSGDADCFMFGATKVIRPTKVGKKRFYYLYERETLLKELDLTPAQFLTLGIYMGNDFAKKVPRVGAKTVIKKMGQHINFTEQQKLALEYFKKAPHKGAITHESKFDKDKLVKFFQRRGFNLDRLRTHITELENMQ